MRLLSVLSPQSLYGYIFVSFFFLYIILIQYCRTHYFRDPTSAFFNADRGYDEIYSGFRVSQAINYIKQIDATASPVNKSSVPTKSDASLCVGIASISREKINYVESAVGSLLVDLNEEERKDVHLILFIPHTDPTVHPSYSSNWMSTVADNLLLYNLPDDQMEHVKNMETEGGMMYEKGLFDYTYLLKACQEVGSPYALFVEDDVIALDGWYHRTRQAFKDAERQTRKINASKC